MSVHLQQIQVTALLFFVDTRSEQIVIGTTVQFYLVAILWPKAQVTNAIDQCRLHLKISNGER